MSPELFARPAQVSKPGRPWPAVAALGLVLALIVPALAWANEGDQAPTKLRLYPFKYQGPGAETPGSATTPGASDFSLAAPVGSSDNGRAGDEAGLSSSIAPWTGLGTNALKMFAGTNAILHLSALAASVIIVESGFDTQVHNFFVRHPGIDRFARSGVEVGSNFPVYLGVGVLGSGLIGGSSELVSAGGAVLQASLLALCYTTTLKALTGRPGPEPVIYDDNEASQTFRFGFLRGGVFHGWPSGHMLANTAAVTSLLAFYNHSTWLKVAGGTYLGFLWLSVISHHGSAMHWFSDTLAGTVMGYAIGTTVGADFRERFEHRQPKAAGFGVSLLPQMLSLSFDLPF